ncbi:MAG: V-type ATP synthase subunit E [Bacteroidetes bacterium 4572_77]|nr:MAG: V-type ATP synthase subunit E [Bacteroidetes bacterium 4572_77]
MTKKILELTEKIYNEGIEKSNEEAKLIIAEAKKEADNMRASAKKEEKEIVEQAKKQADEMKKNAQMEIRLASLQSVSNLKQQIAKVITASQVEAPVKESFKDADFIKKIILMMLTNWNAQKEDDLNVQLLLPASEEKMFTDFFEQKAKNLLDAGLEINFDTNVKSGFRVGPKEGSYYISFTDKDFENYFKSYLKPKTIKMLFEE